MKFPGILLTPETYNLFGSNRERGNAKRKEKSFLKGKPFYTHYGLIKDKDGVDVVHKSKRLVMEFAPLFNEDILNKADEESSNDTPRPDTARGDGNTTEAGHEGRPQEEV